MVPFFDNFGVLYKFKQIESVVVSYINNPKDHHYIIPAPASADFRY